jgi:hypothetical protein
MLMTAAATSAAVKKSVAATAAATNKFKAPSVFMAGGVFLIKINVKKT